MSKILQIFVGIILLIIFPIWLLFISPEILKLPTSISDRANMIHAENNRFEINSNWTGKSLALSSSTIKTFQTVGNKSTIQSQFKVESLTGEALFHLNQNFSVDRQTRHNLPGGTDSTGTASIFFPPNPDQKPINFWPFEMGAPTTLQYVGNKTIQKLNTYHYAAENQIIDDTPGYEFLPLVPEKYKALSRVKIDVYVDPLTGTIIDYADSGVSYYADKDNKPVWDIAEWSNKYNDPTIISRVKEAKSKGVSFLIVSRIIPYALAIVGLYLILSGILKKDRLLISRKK